MKDERKSRKALGGRGIWSFALFLPCLVLIEGLDWTGVGVCVIVPGVMAGGLDPGRSVRGTNMGEVGVVDGEVF